MSVAAIIVSWDDAEATAAAVESLRAQTVPPDEIVVVDNHPAHPAARSKTIHRCAQVIASPENLGFAGGVSVGVRATSSEWVFLLNPDAQAAPDCLERLLDAARAGTGVVGAQLLAADGRVNGGDNPVHLTGITWAGHFGEPPDLGPPRSVASVSGAAMLLRRSALDELGGLNEGYFLYHEDVEVCWRMRLAGWDVVFQPAATALHDYAFDKGADKWLLLERNRMRTVFTCYSGRALLILSPLLLASEVAIALAARRGGWWPEKRRALKAVFGERRSIRARRRRVQATRAVPDADLVRLMTAEFDAAFVEAPLVRTAGPALEYYRRCVIRLLS